MNLFNLPIVRHITAGIIILGVGFYFGNSLFKNKLREARKEANAISGKYEQLNYNYELLTGRTDTLQSVVILLAKRERIKVENHLTDNKAKKGAAFNFIPKTQLELEHINTLKKTKKRGFFRRLFLKKTKKTTN